MDGSKTSSCRVSGIPRPSRVPLPSQSSDKSRNGSVAKTVAVDSEPRTPSRTIGGQIAKTKTALLQRQDAHTARAEPQRAENDAATSTASVQTPKNRRPRPSLSDRTLETLAQIPKTPQSSRRRSSFFTSQSPMTSPVRPSSAAHIRRPSTRQDEDIPPLSATSYRSRTPSPEKPARLPLAKAEPPRARPMGPPPSIPRQARDQTKAKSEMSRTTTRTQPAIQNRVPVKAKEQSSKIIPQKPGRSIGMAKDKLGILEQKTPLGNGLAAQTPPKSSAALREAIARAKAAHRGAPGNAVKSSLPASDPDGNMSGVSCEGGSRLVMQKRIATARKEGRLNISSMGLIELPAELRNIYEPNASLSGDSSWAESVDLVKLVAADNEITELNDDFFPNFDEGFDASGSRDSNVLAGLEILDLHSNKLIKIPSRFEALHFLSTLNLSRNRLDESVMSLLARLTSLRELRLAENKISHLEQLDEHNWPKLEILDLSKNGFLTIPSGLGSLPKLHTLILSDNKLKELPDDVTQSCQLRELVLTRNNLQGNLLATTGSQLVSLKTLDVSHNALSSLSVQPYLELPILQNLGLSENRIKALPDIEKCSRLITLVADGNQLGEIPPGVTALKSLKQLDLSRNDLRTVDDLIGSMESLTTICLANNPIRERRLLNMNTDDLKQELRNRNVQDSNGDGELRGETASALENHLAVENLSHLGGALNWSSLRLTSLDKTTLEHVSQNASIKSLNLTRNLLIDIPLSVGLLASTLTSLDLSSNKVNGKTYLEESINLPKLKTLNLASNGLLSLFPLLSSLSAAALSELNVARNRLTELPVLRDRFPSLRTVLAADNVISILPFEIVAGLEVLDVSANEINHLDPKIGLLANEGLRTLLVGANTFRVPRRDVVEKGTEAILTWLRGRIPDD